MTVDDRPTHGYEYGPDEVAWFEAFDLGPVEPSAIERRLDAGDVLETVDVPSNLNRSLVVQAGTGDALYRLVQLFGTPNVPGLEAGADQPDREKTTWQYLFEATYDPNDEDPNAGRYLLSVYDYKTKVSVGLSTWVEPDEPIDRAVFEPGDELPDQLDLPDEEFLVGLVQLVLHVVDDPVPATYKDLWV